MGKDAADFVRYSIVTDFGSDRDLDKFKQIIQSVTNINNHTKRSIIEQAATLTSHEGITLTVDQLKSAFWAILKTKVAKDDIEELKGTTLDLWVVTINKLQEDKELGDAEHFVTAITQLYDLNSDLSQ